ncbi:MAG TPA: glycosyltransferase [Prolixibacteraceae bacterium]|jgi:glycosyltransferase involved in cell wall biosynthesis
MSNKYKIVILCGANPYQGPGIIATDLQNRLNKDGHSVEIISNHYFLEIDKTIKSLGQKKTIINRLLNKINPSNIYSKFKTNWNRQYKSKYIMLSVLGQNKPHYSKAVLKRINDKPDIIIYLFSHYFLNPVDLENIYNTTGAPILYWLVDSAAMTGGCHFTWDCQGYKNKCGKCPGIKSKITNDQTSVNIIHKLKVFQRINIQPIYATEQQRIMLSQSTVFKNIKSHKAYGIVDENKFSKSSAFRKKHDLPDNRKLIFFAASQIDDERKGMRILNKALNLLSEKFTDTERNGIILVIAGNSFDKISLHWTFHYKHLGYISQNDFSEIMSSADLFICPSIEDSGPTVINQSLMCGTPVVAFDMGVAKDFIQNGYTGYRAKLGDENDLANGIYSLLSMSSEELKRISENCRKIAIENFSAKNVLTQFNTIFEDVINKNPA